MAELNFGIAMEGAVTAAGPIVVENLELVLKQTQTFIHDGLYDFIRDANNFQKLVATPKSTKQTPSLNIDELFQRISPIIPKEFVVKIDNAVFSAVKTNSPNDFSAKLHSLSVRCFNFEFVFVSCSFSVVSFDFQLNGKYSTNPLEQEFQLPLMYVAFQLKHLEIDTQLEKLLFVELFTIDAKVSLSYISSSVEFTL